MDCFRLSDRGDGMKGKSAVRDIQNETTVFRAHADIGDLHEFRSWSLTTVSLCHRGIAHLHRQLYFRLGIWSAFYFLRQLGCTCFKVRSKPNCRVHYRAGNLTRQRRKTNELSEKYIGAIRAARPRQSTRQGSKWFGRKPAMYNAACSEVHGGSRDANEACDTHLRQRADIGDHGTRAGHSFFPP